MPANENFDQKYDLIKFQFLLIISVCVSLAFLSGCKGYQYAQEIDQYVNQNDCTYYLLIENECGITFSHDDKFIALRNEPRRLPWNDTVEVFSTGGGPPVFELPNEYHASIAAVRFYSNKQ